MVARLFLLAFLTFSSALAAQPPDDLKPLFDAFAADRAAAKGDPATADRLAAKAEDARKAENFAAAARLIRQARWALPATPANLPEGVRAIGFQRLRHDGERVNAVRYNRDGSRLVSCSEDLTVRVWDVPTGRELARYRGHIRPADDKSGISNQPLKIPDAIFLPDGRSVASIGFSQIHVWDIATGKTQKVLKIEDKITEKKEAKPNTKPFTLHAKCLAASDDGKFLASGGDDKFLRVWNLDTGLEIYKSTPHSSRFEAVAWQPKGRHVAAVDADGFVAVYDPFGENKSPLLKQQVTDGNSSPAHAVCFTPDGAKLLTGGNDKVPRVLPAPGLDGAVPPNVAAAVQKLPMMDGAIHAVAVSADGHFYLAAGPDEKNLGIVRVVDALGQPVRSFTAPSRINGIAIRPDGLQIAAACEDGGLHVWDFVPADDHKVASEAKDALWATAVNAEGTAFAAAGADKTIRIYTLTGKLLHTLTGSEGAVTSLVWLPNDRLLSAGGDKLVRLWDTKAGQPLAKWPGHTAAVLALAATPDGRSAVSGASDETVTGWDIAAGKSTWTWTARSAVTALAIAPDGKRVVVGGADGGMTVLAIADGKAAVTGYANAHISGVGALAFNSDGTILASAGGDGLPKTWTLSADAPPVQALRFAPQVKKMSPAPQALSAVAISPDGKRLAAGGADRVVRIYDAATTGNELRTLRGCTDWVTSLAFGADGERLVAVSADKSARVFDVMQIDAGRSVGHISPARGVGLSKDGTKLASVGDDKTLHIWNAASGTETGTRPIGVSAPQFATLFLGETHLATAGQDGTLRLWSLTGELPPAAISLGPIYALAPVSPAGTFGVWVAESRTTNKYLRCSAADGKVLGTVVERNRQVTAVSFAPDLSLAASGDANGSVAFWNLAPRFQWRFRAELFPATRTQVKALRVRTFGRLTLPMMLVAGTRIIDLGFTPDRQTLIVIDPKGEVSFFDVAAKKVTKSVLVMGESIEPVNGLIVAPDGNKFVVLGSDGDTRVFDLTGKELKKFALPSAARSGVFSADGKILYTANADGSLYAITMP